MLRQILPHSAVLLGLSFFACGDEETTGKTTNPTPDASGTDANADTGADQSSSSDASDAGSEEASSEDAPSEGEAAVDAGPKLYEVHLVQQLTGMPFSAPLGMNESGQVVGYAGDEAFSPISEPVRVDPPATLVKLSTPSPNYGFARGIVDDGSLIVGEYEFQGAYWEAGTKQQMAPMPGFFSTSAWGVNESGLVVGTFADHDDPPPPVGPRPCYWSSVAANPVALQTLDGNPTGLAFSVNDSGAIAGVSGSNQGYVAVRWPSVSSAPDNLGHVTGAILTEARAISSNGHIAGRSGFQDGTGRAFWLPAGTSGLIALPLLLNPAVQYAEAFGVNAAGLVVGTATTPQQTAHAVGWVNGAIFDFNDQLVAPHPDVQYLSSAVAVSDTGLVAAEAVLVGSTGDTLRAIAVLVPK